MSTKCVNYCYHVSCASKVDGSTLIIRRTNYNARCLNITEASHLSLVTNGKLYVFQLQVILVEQMQMQTSCLDTLFLHRILIKGTEVLLISSFAAVVPRISSEGSPHQHQIYLYLWNINDDHCYVLKLTIVSIKWLTKSTRIEILLILLFCYFPWSDFAH